MADTDIVTLEEVKTHLNMAADDTSQDAELAGFISAATEVIEHVVGPVVARSVSEQHAGGTAALVLRKTPVLSVTSVTESGTLVDAAAYTPSLGAGLLYRSSGCWAPGPASVTVVYQAGRTSTPASIRLAALELVAFLFRPQLGGNFSPFDSGGDGADAGRQVLGFLVPNKVLQLLEPHEQMAGFA